jgi:hypothetical protein
VHHGLNFSPLLWLASDTLSQERRRIAPRGTEAVPGGARDWEAKLGWLPRWGVQGLGNQDQWEGCLLEGLTPPHEDFRI